MRSRIGPRLEFASANIFALYEPPKLIHAHFLFGTGDTKTISIAVVVFQNFSKPL